MNPDFRNDTGLLTSIERIVDGLLHGREQRFARIIESEQMPVLGEKFAYGNVALFRRHRFRRQPAPRFGWVGTFWHIFSMFLHCEFQSGIDEGQIRSYFHSDEN